jgi:Flp pilus assembly protein TadD
MRFFLANLEARTQQYDQAIADFQWLLQRNPKSPDLHFSLSMTYRSKGDLKAAAEHLRKARDLNPVSPNLWLQLGLVLDSSGQSEEARASYEQVLKLEPDNAIALNNLAYKIAETGGDLDQALTFAQRAKQKMPQDLNVADTLGWIYIKKNLSDSAIEIFRDLVAKNPANPTYRYHLGMAFYQKGDKPQAKRELQAALQRKPPKDEEQKIKELLGKVS